MSNWIGSTSSSSSSIRLLVSIGTLLVAASMYYIVTAHFHTEPSEADVDDDGFLVHKNNNDKTSSASSSRKKETPILPSHIQREIYKLKQRKSKIPLISMKKPMYDNVYMMDQENELLCTVSSKKANWYINKGIAEWTSFQMDKKTTNEDNDHSYSEDAKCIRLLFAHSGSRQRRQSNTTSIEQAKAPSSPSERMYLCSAKRNICVSCGKSDHHIRHYIVPYAYRTLLPDKYKSHMSHDIVILCPDCHLDCERFTKRRMKDMEYKLRMKVARRDEKEVDNDSGGNSAVAHYKNTIDPVIDDPKLGQVRSCALALMKWKTTMPEEQVERYEMVVRTYLASVCTNEGEKGTLLHRKEDEELTKIQLQKAINVKYRAKNPNYIPGAEIVIKSLNGEETSIEFFIREWRQFFIETVQPRHMPMGWNINNPVVCGTRESEEDGD